MPRHGFTPSSRLLYDDIRPGVKLPSGLPSAPRTGKGKAAGTRVPAERHERRSRKEDDSTYLFRHMEEAEYERAVDEFKKRGLP